MCVCVTVGVCFVSGIFGTKSHQKYPTHGLALKGGFFCEVICGILWAFWSWALMLGLGHSFMDFLGWKAMIDFKTDEYIWEAVIRWDVAKVTKE